MILKLILFLGLALVCQGFNNSTCTKCFETGTYKCGTTNEEPCVCHVGVYDPDCSKKDRNCSDQYCKNGGTCAFGDSIWGCNCPEGFWGRICEHIDSEVSHLDKVEKELEQKYCGEDKGCEPPYLKVVCSRKNLDKCDEKGNAHPFKKCPYPWYCFEAMANGKCDWECERKECLYDGYECSTNRVCNERCLTSSGTCDLECSLRTLIAKDEEKIYKNSTKLQFSLAVSEQFWWENKREIIANISEPLRTPLVYKPEHNAHLEKYKNSLEKVLSRGRRSVSNENRYITVNLDLLHEVCKHDSECTADGETAKKLLDSLACKENFNGLLKCNGFSSQKKNNGSTILAVCMVFIAVPMLLIGFRVVSASIWVPPKSEIEAPVIIPVQELPRDPYSRYPTPLHEEAYSLSRIALPIRQEYVNIMDEQGRTPLFWLIASKKPSLLMLDDVNELIKAGANVNHSDDKGCSPLSIAITALRPSICDRLVQWGANPAAITSSEASCLHLAVAQDDIKCVEWLLTFPVVRNNINEVDDSDRTPLAMAAQGGVASAQIAEILIAAGADVLHQGNHYTMWRYRGRSALHWAALFNNLEVMKVLLDHRSDVNCVDTENCAALHLAVQRGSEAAVRMLLEAHASTIIPNGLGATPLGIAKEMGMQPLIELISWYTDVRKEGLVMKKKTRKRENKLPYAGVEYSKRTCTDSPFYSDSISDHSGSTISGYFTSAYSSDSSSIGSANSMTPSSVSTYSVPTSPWSSSSDSLSSYTQFNAKLARPSALPPIQEKPISQFSFDFVHSEVDVPPGAGYYPDYSCPPLTDESGVAEDYFDSVLLSPFSENSCHGSGPDSPSENLGASYWMDQEKKPFDGFGNEEEILHEFFVDWQNY